MNNKPHIGHLIQAELKKQGKSTTWLSAQIGYSREHMYKIFRNEYIYTDTLLKISLILKHDFFKYYSNYLHQQKRNVMFFEQKIDDI